MYWGLPWGCRNPALSSTAPPKSPEAVRPLQLDAQLPFPMASLTQGSGPGVLPWSPPPHSREGGLPAPGKSPVGLARCPAPPGPPLPVASHPPQGSHAVGNKPQEQAHGPAALPVLPGSPEGPGGAHCRAICPAGSRAREEMKAVRLKHNRGGSRESRKWGRGPRAGSAAAAGAGAQSPQPSNEQNSHWAQRSQPVLQAARRLLNSAQVGSQVRGGVRRGWAPHQERILRARCCIRQDGA